MKKKVYNTKDLKFAEFKYEYRFNYYDSCGENYVVVNGQRNGLLYCGDGVLVDLVSGIEVKPENIISEVPIASMDVDLSLDKILSIFSDVERYNNYMAIELRGERSLQMGDLFSCVPANAMFRASKIKYGLRDEFDTRAMLADEAKGQEAKCELDKVTSRVKKLFKRK